MSALTTSESRTEQINTLCDLIEARNDPAGLKGDLDQLCELVQCLDLCINRHEWNCLKGVIHQALADIDPPPDLPM